MSKTKTYYWLKLPKDFFEQKEIKRLRKLAGGDTFTIIYLKMLLRSLPVNGYIYFEGLYDSFEEELADDIYEDADNVKIVVEYLIRCGILQQVSESEYYLAATEEMTGKETESAKRMRVKRNNDKLLLETQDIEIASHCDADVQQSDENVTTEIRDKSKSKSKSKSIELDTAKAVNNTPNGVYSANALCMRIVDEYNTICVSYPKVKSLSEKRKKAIKARLKTYTLDDFTTLFEKAEASSFLKGKNNRDWSASFDWLIADANMAKTLDGNYDERGKPNTLSKWEGVI